MKLICGAVKASVLDYECLSKVVDYLLLQQFFCSETILHILAGVAHRLSNVMELTRHLNQHTRQKTQNDLVLLTLVSHQTVTEKIYLHHVHNTRGVRRSPLKGEGLRQLCPNLGNHVVRRMIR